MGCIRYASGCLKEVLRVLNTEEIFKQNEINDLKRFFVVLK